MSNDNRRGISGFTLIVLLIIALGLGAAVGILGWIWISGGSGQPSLTVEEALATRDAEDLSVIDSVGTVVNSAVQLVSTQVADLGATLDTANAASDADAMATSEAQDSTMLEEIGAVVSDAVNSVSTQVAGIGATLEAFTGEPLEFAIVAAESRATFTLQEDLRGVRTTVVGATSEVGGNIMVDLANPVASSIGAIVINARTLETDNSFRNRAIRSQILKSAQDEFEFIVFEPQELSNFSAESISIGETIRFDVTGNLTVTDITRAETFNVEVTLDNENQISGRATLRVLRGDYNLVIPNVPSVANVTDEVDLALEFVARASG